MSQKIKFLTVFLASFVIIAGICFVFYKPFLTQKDNQTVDFSTWKTYTNTTCGFSFKYPSDLIINPETESVVGVRTQEDLDFQNAQDGEVPPFFFLYAECLPDLKTLIAQSGVSPAPETIENLSDFFTANVNPSLRLLSNTIVDGQPAFATAAGLGSATYSVWIEHNKIYELSFSEIFRENAVADYDHLSLIQQQILASFTFTK